MRCTPLSPTKVTTKQILQYVLEINPVNFLIAEVSVNKQCIKPQEEYSCSAGECLSLGVIVANHLTQPLHKLCLSVQFYQDYNNGVLNYKLDNRVATAGNNKYAFIFYKIIQTLYIQPHKTVIFRYSKFKHQVNFVRFNAICWRFQQFVYLRVSLTMNILYLIIIMHITNTIRESLHFVKVKPK